jgi:hypothetical protein
LVPEDPTLDQLAERIRTAIGNVAKHMVHTLQSAMDAGDDLILAKAKVIAEKGHGHWMPGLLGNCTKSGRTARGCVFLARRRSEAEALIKAHNGSDANLTINKVLSLLRISEDTDDTDNTDNATDSPPNPPAESPPAESPPVEPIPKAKQRRGPTRRRTPPKPENMRC